MATNYETYTKFANEVEALARAGAEKNQTDQSPTGSEYAYMFGYTLGSIPNLLHDLKLTDEQVQIIAEYHNHPVYQDM